MCGQRSRDLNLCCWIEGGIVTQLQTRIKRAFLYSCSLRWRYARVGLTLPRRTAYWCWTRVFMRSATVIVVQCQPTASAPDITKKHSSGKRAALLVMVLGALLQFIKRICILMVGLLRLSYRKAAEYQSVRYCNCPLSPLTEARLRKYDIACIVWS